MYAYVSSTVTVHPLGKRAYAVDVVVPAELFPLLDAVLTDAQKEVAQREKCSFYLDQFSNGSWLFGLAIGLDDHLDLWSYTKSTVPAWAEGLRGG